MSQRIIHVPVFKAPPLDLRIDYTFPGASLLSEREEIKKKRPLSKKSKRAPCAGLCRMFENKMKELEEELSLKTARVSELRRRLKEMDEGEERAGRRIRQLEEQVRAGNSRPEPPGSLCTLTAGCWN